MASMQGRTCFLVDILKEELSEKSNDPLSRGILIGIKLMGLCGEQWFDNADHAMSFREDKEEETGFSGWEEVYSEMELCLVDEEEEEEESSDEEEKDEEEKDEEEKGVDYYEADMKELYRDRIGPNEWAP